MIDEEKVLVQIQNDDKNVPLFVYKRQDIISDFIKQNYGFYEQHILKYISNKYPKQNNIIDIGANIGNHSKYFANFLEFNKLFSFEPQSTNFTLLELNMRSEKCVSFNCALGSCRARCDIRIDDDTQMGTGRVHLGNTIDIVPLDDFNIIDVTLIKIDVVDFEYQVLLGAMRTILKYMPTIFIETENSDVVKLLNLMGYEKVKMFYQGDVAIPQGSPTIEFVHRSKL